MQNNEVACLSITQNKIILCNGLQINKCKIMNKHRPKSMPITVTSCKS